MKHKAIQIFTIAVSLSVLFGLFAVNTQAATTLTSNSIGTIDGFYYELWKESGTASMTLNGGATFSCEWNTDNKVMFKTGGKFYRNNKYKQDISNIWVDYDCSY